MAAEAFAALEKILESRQRRESTDKMTLIDKLTDEYEQLVKELQEIVNKINHMIDGSGEQ